MLQYQRKRPDAAAKILGGVDHPNLRGEVRFYQQKTGTLVVADIQGLPDGFFAFHIHEGRSCGGAGFADSMGHFNPGHALHPNHAGDLPPLLSTNGRAFLAVFTGRFFTQDVIGRTVIIHSDPDDFHTQPAGNAGKKIACGMIYRQ